ncbi:MAG: hypothetical protein ACYCSV_09830, partial [Leptospirillum sp.]
EVNAFCREHLNPYVNFHRPCFFPKTVTDAKGKEKVRHEATSVKLSSNGPAFQQAEPTGTCVGSNPRV